MPKKLIVIAMSLLFLAGCGASDSKSAAAPEANIIQNSPQENESAPNQAYPASDETTVTAKKTEISDGITEAAEKSDLQYFTFNRESRSESNDEGITLLTENRCEVSLHSGDSNNQEWIKDILGDNQAFYDTNSRNLVRYAEDVISQYGSDEFYTYSNYQDRGIVRHDSRVVSLLTISHVHSGGAHPSTVQTAMNLDLEQKKMLTLEEVIAEDGVEVLEQMVQDIVKNKFERLGIDVLYEDYSETIAISMTYGSMTPYWYFSNKGLVIFYNQYELGPYAAGIIKVEIPYEKLHGILLEEFFPEVSEDCTGDLSVVTDTQGLEQIPCVIDPDGGRILIRAEGTAKFVQVSEVLWVDDTPVSQTMMISINELNEQDVLVLTGGFDDDSRSFSVEFSDGCGNRYTYFIHPDGLTEEP